MRSLCTHSKFCTTEASPQPHDRLILLQLGSDHATVGSQAVARVKIQCCCVPQSHKNATDLQVSESLLVVSCVCTHTPVWCMCTSVFTCVCTLVCTHIHCPSGNARETLIFIREVLCPLEDMMAMESKATRGIFGSSRKSRLN